MCIWRQCVIGGEILPRLFQQEKVTRSFFFVVNIGILDSKRIVDFPFFLTHYWPKFSIPQKLHQRISSWSWSVLLSLGESGPFVVTNTTNLPACPPIPTSVLFLSVSLYISYGTHTVPSFLAIYVGFSWFPFDILAFRCFTIQHCVGYWRCACTGWQHYRRISMGTFELCKYKVPIVNISKNVNVKISIKAKVKVNVKGRGAVLLKTTREMLSNRRSVCVSKHPFITPRTKTFKVIVSLSLQSVERERGRGEMRPQHSAAQHMACHVFR